MADGAAPHDQVARRATACYEVVAPMGLVVRDGPELNCKKVATLEQGLAFSVFEIQTSLLGLTRLRTELGWVGGRTAEGHVLAKPLEANMQEVVRPIPPISRPPPVASPPPVSCPLPRVASLPEPRRAPSQKAVPKASKQRRLARVDAAATKCHVDGNASSCATLDSAVAPVEDKLGGDQAKDEVAKLERKLQRLRDDLERVKVKRRTTGKKAPHESKEFDCKAEQPPRQMRDRETAQTSNKVDRCQYVGINPSRKRRAQGHLSHQAEQREFLEKVAKSKSLIPLHPLGPLPAQPEALPAEASSDARLSPPPGDLALEPGDQSGAASNVCVEAELEPPPGDWGLPPGGPLRSLVSTSPPTISVEPPPGDWEPVPGRHDLAAFRSADPWWRTAATSLGKTEAESLARDAYAIRTILKAKSLDHHPSFVAVIGRAPERKLSKKLRGIFLKVRYQKFCGRPYYQLIEQALQPSDSKNGIGALECREVFIFWSAKRCRWKISNELDEWKQGYAWCAEDCFLPEEAKGWMVYEGSYRGYLKDSALAVVPLQFSRARATSQSSQSGRIDEGQNSSHDSPAPLQALSSNHQGDSSGHDAATLETTSASFGCTQEGRGSSRHAPSSLETPSSNLDQAHEGDGSGHDAPTAHEIQSANHGPILEGQSSSHDAPAALHTPSSKLGQIHEDCSGHDAPTALDTPSTNDAQIHEGHISSHDAPMALQTSYSSQCRVHEERGSGHDAPTSLRAPSSSNGWMDEAHSSSNDAPIALQTPSCSSHDAPTASRAPPLVAQSDLTPEITPEMPRDLTKDAPTVLQAPPTMTQEDLTPEMLQGKWAHSRGGSVVIELVGDKFLIRNPHGGNEQIAIKKFMRNRCLSYWGNEGVIRGNVITWSNGSSWKR